MKAKRFNSMLFFVETICPNCEAFRDNVIFVLEPQHTWCLECKGGYKITKDDLKFATANTAVLVEKKKRKKKKKKSGKVKAVTDKQFRR